MKETDKGNREWHGWARNDIQNPWRMSRFERSKAPIDPIVRAEKPEAEPQWNDVTGIVRDNIKAIQNGESLEPVRQARQNMWGRTVDKSPVVSSLPVKEREHDPIREAEMREVSNAMLHEPTSEAGTMPQSGDITPELPQQ